MPAEAFLDTNVIIYAVGDDPVRSPVAAELLREGCTISVQVMNEFANICRRKLQLPWRDIDLHLDTIQHFAMAVRPIEASTHLLGRQIAERHRLQFYDALMLAAALEAGCRQFFSEDLQHGFTISELSVVNPFRAAGT